MKHALRPALAGILCLLATLALVAPVRANESPEKTAVDAAELVRALIANENRIHELESLSLRVRGKWTRTAREIATERAELEKRFPPETVTPERFPALRPVREETLELDFDRKRLRVVDTQTDVSTRVKVWNGREACLYEKFLTHTQEGYCLDDTPLDNFAHIQSLIWLASGAHFFWWNSSEYPIGATTFWHDGERLRSKVSGTPEEFVLTGRQKFRGRECHVLGFAPDFGWPARQIYVGVEDGRLYGQTSFRLDREVHREIISRLAGEPLENGYAWTAWKERLDASERKELERRHATEILSQFEPSNEHYFDGHREISPGFWVPMRFGYAFFEKGTKREIGTQRDLEIVEWKVNSTLPDELFVVDMIEGVRVCDKRHDPVLFYDYKRSFSPEEWQAILDKHEESSTRLARMKARQDRRIGTQAVEFPETRWIHSEPMTWKELRGRIVVLHFCADWCVPCKNDLPFVESWHQGRESSGVTVIGVHTPTDSVDDVTKMAREYKLHYPICIDSKKPEDARGFGFLSSWYAIEGIPHAVVVDAKGLVAGHGSLDDALSLARKLAAEASERKEPSPPADGPDE